MANSRLKVGPTSYFLCRFIIRFGMGCCAFRWFILRTSFSFLLIAYIILASGILSRFVLHFVEHESFKYS